MEEWVKVLDIVKMKVLQKEEIENAKKYWDGLLKDTNIKYKYDIIQKTEYSNIDRTKGYDSQLKSLFILELYVQNQDVDKINNILNEIKESKIIKESKELQEEIEEDVESSKYTKRAKILKRIYITIFGLMILTIIFAMVYSNVNQ